MEHVTSYNMHFLHLEATKRPRIL